MIPPTFTASGQPAIPGPWTKSGRTIVKPSSAPTSSTSIRPGTNSNTSAGGILLYGLCWGLLGFGSFGAQPLLALIALVGISFCALTILALFTGNGSCDPQ